MQHAREVNQAVAAVARTFEVGDTDVDFFCECEAVDCAERLSLSISTYDGLLAASEPLLVVGHPRVHATEARSLAEDLSASRGVF